jgi:segregation and condensation protein B
VSGDGNDHRPGNGNGNGSANGGSGEGRAVEPGEAVDERRIEARRAIEAVVMAATDPVETVVLAQLLELPLHQIEQLCVDLAVEYEVQGRGFALAKVAGGWRYQTHPDLAGYVERSILEGQQARLSNAAMDTLAIIAYKQPISRGQLAAIRGVSVDGVVRTLLQRGYIEECGRDQGPGQAVLYGTTRLFLEDLGLVGLADLPPLGEFVPGPEIMDTLEASLRPSDDEDAPVADADADEPEAAAPDTPAEAEEPEEPSAGDGGHAGA